MMDTAIVYGLRDQSKHDYFYVGSTKFEPSHRLAQHLDLVKRGQHYNRHLANTVCKIGLDNVVIDVLEVTDTDNRWNVELDWINKLTADGMRLVNLVYNGKYSVSVNMQEQYALDHPITIDAMAFGVALILIDNGYPEKLFALQETSLYTRCSERLILAWYQSWRSLAMSPGSSLGKTLSGELISTMRQMFERFPNETQVDIQRLLKA